MNRLTCVSMMTVALAVGAIPAQAQNPQNLLIVSIGDSYASGEGNPNSFGANGAQWSSTPCHRSQNNGRRFAATRINNLPNVSTTFADFACSGATINSGVLGTMTSSAPETPGVVLAAQLDRAVAFQQQQNGRPIDILMVSIGGNDAGFASVVTECLLPNDCRTSTVVTNSVQRVTTVLPGRYDNLGEQIRTRLNVRQVYITHYPNVVQSENGQFCGDFDDFFTPQGDVAGLAMRFVSNVESQFLLNSFIRPLNDQVDAAAARNGWRVVSGVEDTFRPHGFCNGLGQRWVNTLGDSFLRQGNHKGTAHPNLDGHRAYADSLVRRATIDFNLPLETPRIIDLDEVNVGNDLGVALPGVVKRVRIEIGQTAAALAVQLQFRVRNPVEFSTPAFTPVTMGDAGAGALNLFQANIPGSEFLLPGQRIEYRVRVTATRNGNTSTTTTSIRSIALGDLLD